MFNVLVTELIDSFTFLGYILVLLFLLDVSGSFEIGTIIGESLLTFLGYCLFLSLLE